jgi:lipoprotein signal peptidase
MHIFALMMCIFIASILRGARWVAQDKELAAISIIANLLVQSGIYYLILKESKRSRQTYLLSFTILLASAITNLIWALD